MKGKILSSGQVIGGAVFIALLLLGVVLYRSVSSFEKTEPEIDKEMMVWQQVEKDKETDNSFENSQKEYKGMTFSKSEEGIESKAKPAKLFKFDPNTASFQDFVDLGLSKRVAHTIQNYREKGGKFYKKEDFAKIYTLPKQDYEKLFPYIEIDKQQFPQRNFSTNYSKNKNRFDHNTPEYSSPQKKNTVVHLNKATTEDLKALKGIGNVFAGRIISYRNVLGGFVKVEQLKEVYGISDSLYNAIKDFIVVEGDMVEKININTAEQKDFLKHPYFRKIGNYIISYRKDVGGFKKIEDFKQVPLINEEIYRKIAPYLTM
ncbi:MAG TPA: helix-hairpin-helix domain-containing protein [Edaphocola sp.]|nr:helix-hairpin-helix domain-containing protein [Edaphocola sp.]